MASAKSIISKKPAEGVAPPERVFPSRTFKRAGNITQTEKALIAQYVADQPAEISSQQVGALAKVLRRSKETVKSLIEEARETLQVNLQDYVEIHKQATMDALAGGTVGGLKVAVEASQWAMENVGIDGVRAVEKAKVEGPSGPRILIGIKVGGVEQPVTSIDVAKVDDEQ